MGGFTPGDIHYNIVSEDSATPTNEKIRQSLAALTAETNKLIAAQLQLGNTPGQPVPPQVPVEDLKKRRMEMQQTYQSMMLTERAFGLHLPRAVNKYLASLQNVQMLMAPLFGLAMFVAVGAAVVKIGESIWDWAVGGLKVAQEQKKFNEELDRSIEKIKDLKRQGELIGYGGKAKQAIEVSQAEQMALDAQKKFEQQRRSADQLAATLKKQQAKEASEGPYWGVSTAVNAMLGVSKGEVAEEQRKANELLAVALELRLKAKNAQQSLVVEIDKEQFLIRVNMIEAGKRVAYADETGRHVSKSYALELTLQTKKKELQDAIDVASGSQLSKDWDIAKALAAQVASLTTQQQIRKEIIEGQKAAFDTEQATAIAERHRLQSDADKHKADMEADAHRRSEEEQTAQEAQYQFRKKLQDQSERDAIQFGTAQEKIQTQIDEMMVGRTARERVAIAQRKVALEFELREHEIINKYKLLGLTITKEEDDLKKSLHLDALDEETQTELDKKRAQNRIDQDKEVAAARRKAEGESNKILRTEENRYRQEAEDAAGKMFDAITSRGKGAFQNLADWIEGTFLTLGRKIFQNFMGILLKPLYKAIDDFFDALNNKGSTGGGGKSQSGGIMSSIGGFLKGIFSSAVGASSSGGGGGGEAAASNWGATGAPGLMSSVGSGASSFGGMNSAFSSGGGWQISGLGSAGTAAVMGGAMIGGQMLMQDAWKQGGVRGIMEGIGGGALTGAAIGTMIMPGIGTAIGAAIGAAVGLVAGIFGGGELRREKEREKIANMQAQRMFNDPGPVSTTGVFGMSGAYSADTDLMGRVRARSSGNITVSPTIVIKQLDPNDLDGVSHKIEQVISDAIVNPTTLIARNIAFAARY
jgi:hypothetical protein